MAATELSLPQDVLPVEPLERFSDEAAANKERTLIFTTAGTWSRSGVQFCMRLANFQDSGGFGLATNAEGKPITSWSYFSGPLGVSPRRVQQLAAFGRAARSLEDMMPPDVFSTLTEAHFRPLLKIKDVAQRVPAMQDAFEMAVQEAQSEADEGGKRTRVRFKSDHVRETVAKKLPPKPAQQDREDYTARILTALHNVEGWVADLRRHGLRSDELDKAISTAVKYVTKLRLEQKKGAE